MHAGLGCPCYRVQGLARWVPVPFLVSRLVCGSLSHSDAVVSRTKGVCLAEWAMFLGALVMIRVSPAHGWCSGGQGASGDTGLAQH